MTDEMISGSAMSVTNVEIYDSTILAWGQAISRPSTTGKTTPEKTGSAHKCRYVRVSQSIPMVIITR